MTVPRKRNLNLTDVIRGSHVMIKAWISGSNPVSREEAERRGSICKTCPYNIRFPTGCAGVCGELLNIAMRVSNSQGTQNDRGLHSCAVCGCYLVVAQWLPLDVQCVAVTDDMKKQFASIPHCWKRCNYSTSEPQTPADVSSPS